VGAVDDDGDAFEGLAAGEGAFGKLDVAAECVVDADGFADLAGGGASMASSSL
jgi:hypothetical protein